MVPGPTWCLHPRAAQPQGYQALGEAPKGGSSLAVPHAEPQLSAAARLHPESCSQRPDKPSDRQLLSFDPNSSRPCGGSWLPLQLPGDTFTGQSLRDDILRCCVRGAQMGRATPAPWGGPVLAPCASYRPD